VDGIAEYILSGKCKNIVFLTGAGVSVGAGIPDFRSPGGMYDTLKPELLTATDQERAIMKREPTYVVNKQLFRVNQFPYLELRRPFILGLAEAKWKATVTHWFIAICQKKGLLRRLFTQNIDGLDFQTNISDNNIVGVHGTLGKIVCEDCHHECPIEEFRDKVKKNIKDIYKMDPTAPEVSTPINCTHCGKPQVKPNTVLYGSQLPSRFFECLKLDFPNHVDLLIVAGTSLTVSPANELPVHVNPSTPRFIVNREKVGRELGIYYGDESKRDIYSNLDCDIVFLYLAHKLGWVEDLKEHIEKMAPESQRLILEYEKTKQVPGFVQVNKM
jgi:NAD-dependent deacetylase sirtuin 2